MFFRLFFDLFSLFFDLFSLSLGVGRPLRAKYRDWWKRIAFHEVIVGFQGKGIQSKFSERRQNVNIFPKYDRLSINLFI